MSRGQPIGSQLAKVPLFSACSKKELAQISRLATEVSAPAGRVLAEEGHLGNEFVVILDGAASVHQGGRRLRTLGPGDYFGEIALLSKSRRLATVIADTPMRLEVINRSEFSTLLDEVPSLARKLLAGLASIVEDQYDTLHRA
jgi:CRP-like cAMP-binding protein